MKKINALAPMAAILLPMNPMNAETLALAKPTRKQLESADLEVDALIHYGLKVYTGQEHGGGQEPLSNFSQRNSMQSNGS